MTEQEIRAENRRTQHEIETGVYVGKLEDNQATLRRQVLSLRSDCIKLTNMVGSLIAQRDELLVQRHEMQEKHDALCASYNQLYADYDQACNALKGSEYK